MSVVPSENNTNQPEDLPKKISRWDRLKKRWNRKGIVEIDVDHHRYEMLNGVRQGMRETILDNPQYIKEKLEPADYTDMYEKMIISPTGKKFIFTSHASAVFVMIRNAIGLSEEEYVNSLAPPTLPYLEFINNSKSGSDFFITNDKCFFMKTDKSYYINVFLNFLGDYLQHFQTYPHSLIVKILGLYSIKVPEGKKLDFLVMQSIFYPDTRVEYRYDIKGCFAGRYQKPPVTGSNVVTVLKDQNFKEMKIKLGATKKDWFLKQIETDAEFMVKLGVQDYSLLVGMHQLAEDEKKDHLSHVVTGLTKNLKMRQTPVHSPQHSSNTPHRDVDNNSTTDPSDSQQIRTGSSSPSRRSIQHGLSFYKPSIFSHNLRLLPDSRNGIHIIDGPTHRYFLGVIDFFTLYECRQRSARFLKSLKYCFGDHSTVPPEKYAERFVKFIREHTVS